MKTDTLHKWADKRDCRGRRARLGKGAILRFPLFYSSTYEFRLTTGKLDTTRIYTKKMRKCLSKKIQV